MTCRPRVILGFLMALSLSPSLGAYRSVLAADQSTQSSTRNNGTKPGVVARRTTSAAQDETATWQRSTQQQGQEEVADIRFSKPNIGSAATQKRQVKQVVMLQGQPPHDVAPAAHSNAPTLVAPAHATPTLQAPTVIASDLYLPARRVPPNSFAPTSAPVRQPAMPVAERGPYGSVPARVPESRGMVAPQIPRSMVPAAVSVAAAQSAEPIQRETEPYVSTEQVAREQVPLTDEQLRLVSQMLLDQQVKHAAEEESLPQSPTTAARGTAERPMNTSGIDYQDNMMCPSDCCPPAPRLFWTGGVEATFLSPDLNSDGVSMEVEEIDDDRYDLTSTLSDDVDSVYVSPRIWLGVQGCVWGANVRYWHLNASEGAFDPTVGSLNTWDGFDCGRTDLGYTSCNSLEAYTIDLELTRKFCVNHCAMQAAVGVRHAEIEHNQGLFGLANTDEGILTGFARANRQSRGTGIQLGLYGRKPLFPCSCVHWFYNARWSALWGPTQTAVETFASVLTTQQNVTASAASVNGAYTNVDDTMFIGEIQLGLEWNYALQCVPANAFFRTAIEYQRWDGGLGYSESQSFAGATIVNQNDPTSIITTTASAAEPQLDLIGLSIGTGLTW